MRKDQSFWVQNRTRRLSRRAILRAGTAGAAIAGLAAIGCGSSARRSGGSTAKQPVGSAAGPAASASNSGLIAANFKAGGTLQLQLNTVAFLDPYYNNSFATFIPAGHTYSRLFRFVASTDSSVFRSHQIAPDLVDSYEIAGDAVTYTMKLKRNVLFHPPLSRPLTTADVLASWQKLTTDPKSINASAFKPIVDSLTAPDDQTLVFKLKAPYAPFINKLANALYFWIQPTDAVEGKIDPSKQMVGTGPWIFVDRTATAYTYRKNPDYYVKGIPYADAAVLNVMLDFATREAQFQAGKIDVDQLPNVDVDAIKKAVPKARAASYDDIYGTYIFFYDITAPDSPFKDVRVRRAISLALDRKGLLDVGYNGEGSWNNLVNPGLGKWWLDPQGKEIGDAGKWFKHDPKQARQLLEAAGHADTEFKWMYSNNSYGDVFNSIADAARGTLADAGFKLTVVTLDYNKDLMNNGQGIFYKGPPLNSMVYQPGPGRFSDADEYLFSMLTRNGNRNQSHVNDPALEAMVRKEQAELDEDKRVVLVKDIQRAADEQMYYVPSLGQIRYDFYQSWIDNPIVTDEFSLGLERNAYLSTNRT